MLVFPCNGAGETTKAGKNMETKGKARMPERAYQYSRLSFSAQREGTGLARQQGDEQTGIANWAHDVCEREGLTLDDEQFTDIDRSGYHQRNLSPKAALTRILQLIEFRRILPGSWLLIDTISRLSRAELDDAIELFRRIVRAGITVCTRTPPRVYRPGDNSLLAHLEPLILAYLAWCESELKSQNARAAWQIHRREQREKKTPHQCPPPCWLELVDGVYQLREDVVKLVRYVHDLTRAGWGYGRLAARLTAEGMPIPARARRLSPRGQSRQDARRWTQSALASLLTSRALVGEYVCMSGVGRQRAADGAPIQGFYPPVMSEDELQATLLAIASRKGRAGRPAQATVNILSNILYLRGSDERLYVRSKAGHAPPGEPDPRSYYARPGGRRPRIRTDRLTAGVLSCLCELQPADVLPPDPQRQEQEEQIVTLTARQTAGLLRQEQLQAALAEAGEEVGAVLSALRSVKADVQATAAALATLKLASTTSRGEALGTVQSLAQLRGALRGRERLDVDGRIAAELSRVVSRVEVEVEYVTPKTTRVRVWVYLTSGAVRDFCLEPESRRAR